MSQTLTDGAIIRSNWTVTGGGSKRLSNYNNEAADNFDDICNNIRGQGHIRVFAIGYDTARLGPDLRDSLRNCATNTDDFFEVSTDELRTALARIASEITTPLLTN